MNATFRYTVRCTFEDPSVADAWVEWLCAEHLRDVCDAGALVAEIVEIDSAQRTIEVRYAFEDRASFERYEADHAPKLREEGLRLFPLELGLSYTRSTGIVLGYWPRATGD